MNDRIQTIRSTLLILGIVATCGLIFTMAATPLHQEEIFYNQDTLSIVELIILFGYALVIIFDASSVVWIGFRTRGQNQYSTLDLIAFLWGILCLFLLAGEKVMLDEIARETRLGWETAGEWVILYGFLTTQLLYNVFMMFHITRSHRILDRKFEESGPAQVPHLT